ncbi:hypothetical protein [Natronolimnohabitans innermongolicus]|uniref:hypothetical protein n=1 Tax=Natronolimnohabitans innermongolicus TaxID=253107 RepID=UPI001375F0AC|nr:hypothetical protein [Natronolimnohabitans innermongolicus]
MAANDTSNGSRTDPERPAIPTAIVADVDSTGRVMIYDERTQTAWISSTNAVALERMV